MIDREFAFLCAYSCAFLAIPGRGKSRPGNHTPVRKRGSGSGSEIGSDTLRASPRTVAAQAALLRAARLKAAKAKAKAKANGNTNANANAKAKAKSKANGNANANANAKSKIPAKPRACPPKRSKRKAVEEVIDLCD